MVAPSKNGCVMLRYRQARQRHALAPLEFRRSEKKVRREDDSSKKEARSPKVEF